MFRRAIDIIPDYAEAYNNLGLALQNLDQYDDANASFRRAYSINPDSAKVCRYIGSTMIILGKPDEAERWFVKAVELAPDDVSVLSTALYYFPRLADEMSIDHIESAYADRNLLSADERIDFGFAMGKVMEHAGQYDKAFSAYAEGNKMYYQENPFDQTKSDESLDRLCGIYSGDLLEEYAAIADSVSDEQDARVPIFIVGMPRSGSTLIEQIISSHNEVFGAGELPIMYELIEEAENFMGVADRTSALSSIRAVGHKYLDRVWRLAPDVRFITDKMLGNHEYLGLIHLFFPQAKIIHSMRDPMDACFSCYAIKFTEGNEFSYDLEALGRYYLRYTKIMEHWHRVLPPGRILDVRYEDIVDNTEHEVKRILEYLELPWDQDCLNFYKNTRAVKTASASQVRKPIYTSSVARWKRFENHLLPLMEIVNGESHS
jgi:tetratricopeptide (TPR) repeat protein